MEDKLDEDTRGQINLLRSRVQRMEGFINGLLEYSRAGRTESAQKEVNVKQLLTEIVEAIDPPPEFTIDISEPMPVLTTEAILLEQVFSNLITNAIKHHHRDDGTVKISASDRR